MRTSVVLLLAVFVLGLVLGSAIPTSQAQGTKLPGIVGVNHVGIAVDNFDETLAFYTQKLGFPVVDTVKNAQGGIQLVFVQVGRDTFLEIAPSNANRPAGLTHFGLHVDNMANMVSALKERGLMATEPRSVGTQWLNSAITLPGNLRMEMSELGPDSPLNKAGAAWK